MERKEDEDSKKGKSVSSQVLEYYKQYSQSKQLPKYFCGSSESFADGLKRMDREKAEETLLEGPTVEVVCPVSPASSIASNRKLEWDNGADIGYSNASTNLLLQKSISLPVLNTIESEKLQKSLLRLSPEGNAETTQSQPLKLSSTTSDSVPSPNDYTSSSSSSGPKPPLPPPSYSSSSSAGASSTKSFVLKDFMQRIGLPMAESTPYANLDDVETPRLTVKPPSNPRTILKSSTKCWDNLSVPKNEGPKAAKPVVVECTSKFVQTSLPKNFSVALQTEPDFSLENSDAESKCTSFEYLSGVDYVEEVHKDISSRPNSSSTSSEIPLAELLATKRSEDDVTNLQRNLELMQKLMKSKKYSSVTKKHYLKKIARRMIDNSAVWVRDEAAKVEPEKETIESDEGKVISKPEEKVEMRNEEDEGVTKTSEEEMVSKEEMIQEKQKKSQPMISEKEEKRPSACSLLEREDRDSKECFHCLQARYDFMRNLDQHSEELKVVQTQEHSPIECAHSQTTKISASKDNVSGLASTTESSRGDLPPLPITKSSESKMPPSPTANSLPSTDLSFKILENELPVMATTAKSKDFQMETFKTEILPVLLKTEDSRLQRNHLFTITTQDDIELYPDIVEGAGGDLKSSRSATSGSSSRSRNWRENTTRSEQLREQQQQSGEHLLNYASKEREHQLDWIKNEISHLSKLRKLLEVKDNKEKNYDDDENARRDVKKKRSADKKQAYKEKKNEDARNMALQKVLQEPVIEDMQGLKKGATVYVLTTEPTTGSSRSSSPNGFSCGCCKPNLDPAARLAAGGLNRVCPVKCVCDTSKNKKPTTVRSPSLVGRNVNADSNAKNLKMVSNECFTTQKAGDNARTTVRRYTFEVPVGPSNSKSTDFDSVSQAKSRQSSANSKRYDTNDELSGSLTSDQMKNCILKSPCGKCCTKKKDQQLACQLVISDEVVVKPQSLPPGKNCTCCACIKKNQQLSKELVSATEIISEAPKIPPKCTCCKCISSLNTSPGRHQSRQSSNYEKVTIRHRSASPVQKCVCCQCCKSPKNCSQQQVGSEELMEMKEVASLDKENQVCLCCVCINRTRGQSNEQASSQGKQAFSKNKVCMCTVSGVDEQNQACMCCRCYVSQTQTTCTNQDKPTQAGGGCCICPKTLSGELVLSETIGNRNFEIRNKVCSCKIVGDDKQNQVCCDCKNETIQTMTQMTSEEAVQALNQGCDSKSQNTQTKDVRSLSGKSVRSYDNGRESSKSKKLSPTKENASSRSSSPTRCNMYPTKSIISPTRSVTSPMRSDRSPKRADRSSKKSVKSPSKRSDWSDQRKSDKSSLRKSDKSSHGKSDISSHEKSDSSSHGKSDKSVREQKERSEHSKEYSCSTHGSDESYDKLKVPSEETLLEPDSWTPTPSEDGHVSTPSSKDECKDVCTNSIPKAEKTQTEKKKSDTCKSTTSRSYSTVSSTTTQSMFCSCCKKTNATPRPVIINQEKIYLCHPCAHHYQGLGYCQNPTFMHPGHVCRCVNNTQDDTIRQIRETICQLERLERDEELCKCKLNKDYSSKTGRCARCKCRIKSKYNSEKGGLAYLLTLESDEKLNVDEDEGGPCSLKEIKIKIPSRRHRKSSGGGQCCKCGRSFNRERGGADCCECDNKKKKKSMKHHHEEKERKRPKKQTWHPSLQEYLWANKPDFVSSAETRRQCMLELAYMREERCQKYKQLLALSDGIPTKDLGYQRPSLFSHEEMTRMTERRYKKLPEVQQKLIDAKNARVRKANKMLAEIFNHNLRMQVLKGVHSLPTTASVIKF